jgi:hypothetical protein
MWAAGFRLALMNVLQEFHAAIINAARAGDGVSVFKRISNGEGSFFLWHGHQSFIASSFHLNFHPLVCFVAARDAHL